MFAVFFRFVTNTRVMDGQTDRQSFNCQDRGSIAASHGKNVTGD